MTFNFSQNYLVFVNTETSLGFLFYIQRKKIVSPFLGFQLILIYPFSFIVDLSINMGIHFRINQDFGLELKMKTPIIFATALAVSGMDGLQELH